METNYYTTLSSIPTSEQFEMPIGDLVDSDLLFETIFINRDHKYLALVEIVSYIDHEMAIVQYIEVYGIDYYISILDTGNLSEYKKDTLKDIIIDRNLDMQELGPLHIEQFNDVKVFEENEEIFFEIISH